MIFNILTTSQCGCKSMHLLLKRGIKSYLTSVRNVEKRTAISKIRLSNHNLMIEKGRHLGLDINQRNCPFCTKDLLEDESHLLLTCKTFSHLRENLFSVAKETIPTFEHLSKEEQLKQLLINDNIIHATGTFLHKALTVRRFLLNRHRGQL